MGKGIQLSLCLAEGFSLVYFGLVYFGEYGWDVSSLCRFLGPAEPARASKCVCGGACEVHLQL